MKLDSFESVIEDVRAGRPIVLVDDASRENEGDITIAAEKATPQLINYMIREARGLICLSLTEERVRALRIPMQVSQNTSPFGTNFTTSIDHRSVIDSGVSASARAKTILAAVDESSQPADFVLPGYVFCVRAVAGGVLKRRGQTEGSVDLARLAGLKPAGVICEVMGRDGKMLSGGALERYCRERGMKITSVEEIVQYRLRNELSIRRVAQCPLAELTAVGLAPEELKGKPLEVVVYVDDMDNEEHLALVYGEPKNDCIVRIHSECLTGDVFGSRRCDCGFQLSAALRRIVDEGAGVVAYLHQEGRGIGLGNKLRAYELQDQGRDTVDANLELGFAADSRNYRVGAKILSDLGLTSVRLLTNNPEKVKALESFGVQVTERLPVIAPLDEANRRYLETKRAKLGHLF